MVEILHEKSEQIFSLKAKVCVFSLENKINSLQFYYTCNILSLYTVIRVKLMGFKTFYNQLLVSGQYLIGIFTLALVFFKKIFYIYFSLKARKHFIL